MRPNQTIQLTGTALRSPSAAVPRCSCLRLRALVPAADLVLVRVVSAFAELFAVVALALFEAAVWLGLVAAKPLRFLFSSSYRKRVRERWRESRPLQVFEFVSGSVILVSFTAIMIWWTSGLLQRRFQEELRHAERLRKAEQIFERTHHEMLSRRRQSDDQK